MGITWVQLFKSTCDHGTLYFKVTCSVMVHFITSLAVLKPKALAMSMVLTGSVQDCSS